MLFTCIFADLYFLTKKGECLCNTSINRIVGFQNNIILLTQSIGKWQHKQQNEKNIPVCCFHLPAKKEKNGFCFNKSSDGFSYFLRI